eukprot:CAMPEP_0194316084 /NCGR_PEP_ID=MMETSP0171-20130528/12899_1 /TAXON_ID=218684 /ORGANISM="Corethron pennatum, Strain L29A3" /LENGTH=66 /DNA_ID=CAMNT_0039072191 /DNA_START=628 /DNA_END=828 /DNA_ORIENTATION=+
MSCWSWSMHVVNAKKITVTTRRVGMAAPPKTSPQGPSTSPPPTCSSAQLTIERNTKSIDPADAAAV